MKGKLKFLNDWYEAVKRLARHERAETALAGVSFIESSIFPIPPDLMLIPMVQADHSKAWRYAFICSIASILGGIAGYFIGVFFYQSLAVPLIEFLGKTEARLGFEARIASANNKDLAVFGAALTPFPYKVITIMSGALSINFATFVAASVAGRSIRFFLVAAIVKKFGDQAEKLMKEHFGKFTIGLFVLMAAFYFGLKALMGH
ncbi:MAG: DedA family protein [Hellea sp.]|nr:DedA family protein [Hellea sp.]